MIDIYGNKIIGKRKKQEDALFYEMHGDNGMAVLCDGMGGMSDGDWASYVAVQFMRYQYNKRISDTNDVAALLLDEIRELDKTISNLVNEKNEIISAGTTFASVIIKDGQAYWSNVGDSKVYLYIQATNRLVKLTRIHNYKLQLDEQLKNNSISQDKYNEELPYSDYLISYLGVGNIAIYDVSGSPYDLQVGDTLVLCCDGVYKCVSDKCLKEILSKKGTAKETVSTVFEEIQKRDYKNQDNASLIVMKYRGNL